MSEIVRDQNPQGGSVSEIVFYTPNNALVCGYEQKAHTIEQLKAEIERLSARFTRPIVCICGSTKFKQAWISENARLTGEGNIVLAVGLWGHHERIAPSEAVKAALDDLHKRKIDLCDWVWVLDVGGYIGVSTKSEIAYAEKIGRSVRYLSKEFPDYTEPVDSMQADNAALQQENERLRAELDSVAQDSASDRMRIQRLVEGAKQKESDLAALVTALDEAVACFYCGRHPVGECCICHNKRDLSNLTPASRAVAERWLKKKKEEE